MTSTSVTSGASPSTAALDEGPTKDEVRVFKNEPKDENPEDHDEQDMEEEKNSIVSHADGSDPNKCSTATTSASNGFVSKPGAATSGHMTITSSSNSDSAFDPSRQTFAPPPGFPPTPWFLLGPIPTVDGNRLGMSPYLPTPPPAHTVPMVMDPKTGLRHPHPHSLFPQMGSPSEAYIPGVGMPPYAFYPPHAAALFQSAASAAAANSLARGGLPGSPLSLFPAAAFSPLASPSGTPISMGTAADLKNASMVSLPSSAILQAGHLASFAQASQAAAAGMAAGMAVAFRPGPSAVHGHGSGSTSGDSDERRHKDKMNHVKKPLNAFMLYMKEMRPVVMAEVGLKERQSAEINRILGRRWHDLSKDEQQKYYEMAREARAKHIQDNPGWSARDNYAINKKKRKKRDKNTNNMELKKCRARFGVDQQDKWCKHCRRKKKCLLFREEGQQVREFYATSNGPGSNDSEREEMDNDHDDVDDLLSPDNSPGSGLVSSTTHDESAGSIGTPLPGTSGVGLPLSAHELKTETVVNLTATADVKPGSSVNKSLSFLFGVTNGHPGLSGIVDGRKSSGGGSPLHFGSRPNKPSPLASGVTSPHHVSSTSRDHHMTVPSPADSNGPSSASSASSSITGDMGPSPASSCGEGRGLLSPSIAPPQTLLPPSHPSAVPHRTSGASGINHSIANLTMKPSTLGPPSFHPVSVVPGRITT